MNISLSKVPVQKMYEHYCHQPNFRLLDEISGDQNLTISEYEKLLSEWFDGDVILFYSGRSGLDLFLKAKGFNRNTHNLRVPDFLSRCVINAITVSAFPVKNGPFDGLLLYHQYGFSQRTTLPNAKNIIEDLAHSFFSKPNSGKRTLMGEAALFSLPKFFPLPGTAGGLIVRNDKLKNKIRKMLEQEKEVSEQLKGRIRKAVYNGARFGSATKKGFLIDSAYELLLKIHLPDRNNMDGFPSSIKSLATIGEERLKRVEKYLSIVGRNGFPNGFWGKNEFFLPFALPYFGELKTLFELERLFKRVNIETGVFHIDIRRNMKNPDYRPCLILPCHHEIPMEVFEEMCKTIKKMNKQFI